MRKLLSCVSVCSLSLLATTTSMNATASSGKVVIVGETQARHFRAQAEGEYYLQTGTFRSASNAMNYQNHLSKMLQYPVTVKTAGNFKIVMVGPMQTASEVQAVGAKVYGGSSSEAAPVVAKHKAAKMVMNQPAMDPAPAVVHHKMHHTVARHQRAYETKMEPVHTTSRSSYAAYEGKMGPVVFAPAFRPFVSGEGSYTWTNVQGIDANVVSFATVTTTQQNKPWGGRMAVGGIYSVADKYAVSAEMGWGYYGHVNMQPSFTSSSNDVIIPQSVGLNMDTMGFDILAGIYYTQPKYDVFFKAGALLESLHAHASMMPASLLRGNTRAQDFIVNGSPSVFTLNEYLAGVMPEIKLGGAYHVTDNWAVTASWMHTFGGNLGALAPHLNFNPTQIGGITLNIENPSLNVAMLGIEYRLG